MNNEENNLNNGSVQNTNANPEILESTPVDSSQPSSNTPQPSAPSNEAEVLTTEDTSSEQTSNDAGAARVETETAGEAHIHLEAYQVHEKKEKKEIVRTAEEEKGYSRRRVAMILFFIFLIAFVIFLPEIRNLYIQYKTHVEEEEIDSGKLICTLDRSTDELDITYTETFSFKNYLLKSFTYKVETKGDANKDVEKFKELYNKCDNLSKSVGTSNLSGIYIECNYVEGDNTVVETQSFDYNTVDKSGVKAAYTEAGFEYPEFELDENINEIEKSVLSGGFSCQKVS